MHLLRQPLIRLLAVNLAGGVAAAVLMLGGLMAINLGNLRGLILADETPGAALGLLLFGLVVTFGSVAMGSAIMGLGRRDGRSRRNGGRRGRGRREPAEVRLRVRM
jgi:hypothetical protein